MCVSFLGEPDIDQYCGYKKEGDKGWHSKYCSTPLPFYCFDEPLIFVTEEKTWEEALEHCRHLPVWHNTVYQNHRYDLASLLTPDDNVIAQKMWEKEAGMVGSFISRQLILISSFSVCDSVFPV